MTRWTKTQKSGWAKLAQLTLFLTPLNNAVKNVMRLSVLLGMTWLCAMVHGSLPDCGTRCNTQYKLDEAACGQDGACFQKAGTAFVHCMQGCQNLTRTETWSMQPQLVVDTTSKRQCLSGCKEKVGSCFSPSILVNKRGVKLKKEIRADGHVGQEFVSSHDGPSTCHLQ